MFKITVHSWQLYITSCTKYNFKFCWVITPTGNVGKNISEYQNDGRCKICTESMATRIICRQRQTSNISHTLLSNRNVDHPNVVGVSRCSNHIFIVAVTPDFNRMHKYNCKTRRETFTFWDLMRHMSKSWRYVVLQTLLLVHHRVRNYHCKPKFASWYVSDETIQYVANNWYVLNYGHHL